MLKQILFWGYRRSFSANSHVRLLTAICPRLALLWFSLIHMLVFLHLCDREVPSIVRMSTGLWLSHVHISLDNQEEDIRARIWFREVSCGSMKAPFRYLQGSVIVYGVMGLVYGVMGSANVVLRGFA